MTSKPSGASGALRGASASPSTAKPVPNVPGGPLDRVAPIELPDQRGRLPRPPIHSGDIAEGEAAPPQGLPEIESESPVPPPRRRDETGVSPVQPPITTGGV